MPLSLLRFDWDIFCSVVDNYGDIGVCLRLARQLVNEGHGSVRLWVDDLASFATIWPSVDPRQDGQWQGGIYIQHWHDTLPANLIPAKVVIEAFACELPADYLAAMANETPVPYWLNLEYLSAESWIDECHGLPSLQYIGQQQLKKYFFFPGFSAASGGLLCEQGLISDRIRWQQDSQAQAHYWSSLDLPPPEKNELRISLFTYESAGVRSLVRSWSQGSTPITLLLPMGRSLNDVLAGAGLSDKSAMVSAGDLLHGGKLAIKLLPMSEQEAYDRLLWSCDLNLIRGEDSFVRAQWAGVPFIWHIYPQEDEAHLVKLDSFLARYVATLPIATANWIRAIHYAINRGDEVADLWSDWPKHRAIWRAHSLQWSQKLVAKGDLVTRLMKFLESRI